MWILWGIVRAVKPDSRLKMDRIGGYPWNMIEEKTVPFVMASTGKTVSGTILIHRLLVTSIRITGTAERTQVNMEIRLDEKVTNEKETRALGIELETLPVFDQLWWLIQALSKSRHFG